MLAQSVAAMTINRSCVLAGHGRSITSETSVTPLFIQQTIERRPAFAKVYVCFSRIRIFLGRIETRTRNRIYCQTIRTVRDISRDDRSIIATCRLRTLTDRLKENYSIDKLYSKQFIIGLAHIWFVPELRVTTVYTFTTCVGYFTSSGIDS